MTNDEYLYSVLAGQEPTPQEIADLRRLRDTIQSQLSVLNGSPRFYYAGSYGKKTMIRARYDLDIVIYWPNGTTYTLKDIYDAVGSTLSKHWRAVNPKTVSWELPFEGGFHIDVVPGRALDAQNYEANLYRTDTQTSLKTSLKKHIDTVRGSDRRDAIRLLKLWRHRKGVPFKKSFLLEMLTIEACKKIPNGQLANQVLAALTYIQDNIMNCNVVDPANSNNSLSDDLNSGTRQQIKNEAQAALSGTWAQLF
jgi:hypothetical protein